MIGRTAKDGSTVGPWGKIGATGLGLLALAGTAAAGQDAAVSARMAGPAFQQPVEHCRAGAPAPVASGGSGILLGTAAWAEGGSCVNLPIARLVAAAQGVDALTWTGVTRILSVERMPAEGARLAWLRIRSEAYHDHLGCRAASWPMEWTLTLRAGTPAAPQVVDLVGIRVAGGSGHADYIRQMDLHAEFRAAGPERTSVHVRFEVVAPFQSPQDAADTVRNVIGRLTGAAEGAALPGPIEDPDCPYPRPSGPAP